MSELKRQESLVDEATVLEYLARYPEFFLRHGAMLDKIRIPHAQKGTILHLGGAKHPARAGFVGNLDKK